MTAIKKLTEKEELYCRQYIELLNQRQAYMASRNTDRMKPNTVDRRASELHKKPHIEARISELMAERQERLEINADYVLRRLVEIDEMDVADIIQDDGSMKPISQWPKVWRTTISGLDIQTIMAGDVETITKKIKWPDKLKNIELLGKHINVSAFSKDDKQSTGDAMVDAISSLIERMPS